MIRYEHDCVFHVGMDARIIVLQVQIRDSMIRGNIFHLGLWVLAMALVLQASIVCRAHVGKCRLLDPQPTLHKYYQSGDIIIGSIVSHTIFHSSLKDFCEQPSRLSSDDFV